MRIITISREFGSGGRELGKRLADCLDYKYYDSEIISAISEKSDMDAGYIENTLKNQQWQNFHFTFRGTLGASPYHRTSKIDLLILQKKVIEEIAAQGKNCVIVGRNADLILREYDPFSIFVCAEMETKIRRCRETDENGKKLSEKELIRKIRQIDDARARTREMMNGPVWGQRDAYQLILNTTEWEIKALVPAVAEFASKWFEMKGIE